MSDLRTSFLKSKLAKLPVMPPLSVGAVAEEQGSGNAFEQEDVVGNLSHKNKSARQRLRDYSPQTAEAYFEQALQVDVALTVGSAAFRVYYTPPKPVEKSAARNAVASVSQAVPDVGTPSLPMLQPGIKIADDVEDDFKPSQASDPGTVFLLHHGAGFSALSYALTAAEITQKTNGEAGVLAFDCRGHGRTQLTDVPTDPLDMSLDTLASDLTSLLSAMYPNQDRMPSLVLVGHSMGGSVVVAASQALIASGFTRVSGVAVLDVVEGTAMDALGVMRSVVLSHPSGFHSIEDAIRWHIDSNTIANLDSARVSVPPLLQRNTSFEPSVSATSQHEEEKEVLVDDDSTTIPHVGEYEYIWTANLLATEPYWTSWFKGLSSRFLSAKTARLLLLAGTDRLDRELMIGQMQGKYQLEVISDVGHSLQQDAPERAARILVDFWKRNERVQLPFKRFKKVGEQ